MQFIAVSTPATSLLFPGKSCKIHFQIVQRLINGPDYEDHRNLLLSFFLLFLLFLFIFFIHTIRVPLILIFLIFFILFCCESSFVLACLCHSSSHYFFFFFSYFYANFMDIFRFSFSKVNQLFSFYSHYFYFKILFTL